MPLLAHSSNELVFDIFDKKIKITDVNKFVISNNILVYNIRNDVFKFELSKLENTSLILQNPSFFKLPTGIHEIKMSKNGSKFGILLKNSTFYVFEDSTLLFSKEKINSFEISDNFVGFETEKDFIIKDLENLKVIHKSHYNYQKYFVFNKFSILVTNKLKNEKEDIFKLYKVSKEEFEEIGNFNSLVNVKCKNSPDGNFVLVNLSTSYVKNSYFASTILYMYDSTKKTFERVNKLTNILDFTFLSDKFCVVYGNQPSYVTIFNYDFTISEKFPKGIRNRIYFNHQESYAAMAGFEQLPGNIEVFDIKTKKKFLSGDELGASKLEWDTNGSYFYVATLKYLKEDNRVTKYDYFGRLISTENFECLNDVAIYGPIEKFEIFKKPTEEIVECKSEVYIPSILKGKSTFKVAPIIKPKQKETEDELLNQLSTIENLKKRLELNEKLEVQELNLILSENKIRKKLELFKKSKK